MALIFGGDYNPEQWPEHTWHDDMRLMGEAGITMVTVGVFAWSRLEPQPGRFDFGWLDRVLDLLHANGIGVDLATASATPPPWLVREHPSVLPVDANGTRLEFGSRQSYCPSSPIFRTAVQRLVRSIAERYKNHPAVRLWHVSNEYGDHVVSCWCDESAEHFRRWLRARYRDIDGLNRAWGTSCWGQHYTRFGQVNPPRKAPGPGNPAQLLDWKRFSSDALLACFETEAAILREVTPNVPVTTNFMGLMPELDYWKWAAAEDLVSNDAYPDPADPVSHVKVALSYDLMRSLKQQPWLLLESAPSAVSWREVNLPKQPGRMRLDSLQAVAHGSDGVMFFQWRQAKYGPEKFHSAMLPHAGTDTRQWRETVELGRELRALAEVKGHTTRADVAMLFDWSSWWALEAVESMPSNRLKLKDMLYTWYEPLFERGIAVDLAPPGRDLGGYRVVIAPNLYMCTVEQAKVLRDFTGTMIVGPFSGVVDENEQVHDGGAPGPLADLLGIAVEEFVPLPDGRTQPISIGAAAHTWTETIRLAGASVLAHYDDGRPAITRKGNAIYVSCLLDDVTGVLAEAGIAEAPLNVEVCRRGPYTFLLNHTGTPQPAPITGIDLRTGHSVAEIAAYDAVVITEGHQ
ncbi:beta-galactosidase [Dactylosporangium roseum]|uniref:Beta-galactosidase n=1 Tax=Dactylosporangium roseum TaxID=47989 RepID=A0ABY5ZB78_9ACTN|nr:beta-galactosidase [Dactylosporangium roseum]UWZ39350.1 beta-galactosidase [Dactylosporangium roseum]